MKKCSSCKEEKPLSNFHKRLDGTQTYCKDCTKLRDAKRWHNMDGSQKEERTAALKRNYEKHNIRYRNSFHLREHGISVEDRQQIFDTQEGRCDSCGDVLKVRTRKNRRTENGWRGELDHDHTTGKIRALLCLPCNTALGLLRDDPIRIEALLGYIRRH